MSATNKQSAWTQIPACETCAAYRRGLLITLVLLALTWWLLP